MSINTNEQSNRIPSWFKGRLYSLVTLGIYLIFTMLVIVSSGVQVLSFGLIIKVILFAFVLWSIHIIRLALLLLWITENEE